MKGGVRKKGDSWYYFFEQGKVNGKRNKVERKGGSTKSEAQKALKKAISEFESLSSNKDKEDKTLSEYLDYWVKEFVEINCKNSTLSRYKELIRIHIKPYLGDYKLKDISSTTLQNFLNQKYKDGYSKNTLTNFYGVLSGSFKMAVYPYELILVNPMINVKLPKYDETKKDKDDLKIITVDEFKQILNRFPEGNIFYIPLQLSFATGMRAAEVCGLTWDCVDLKRGIIRVEKILVNENKKWVFSTPKTQSSYREIAIGNTLINILKKYRKDQLSNKLSYGENYHNSNNVCTKENGELVTTYSFKYLSFVVNHNLKINFNFHSLRHTHATLLLERGANIKDIQERLGHSKLATTMDTYAHITDKMKLDSVNRLELINSKLK